MQTDICRAHDRNTGQPCNNPALANTGLCHQHGGKAVEKAIATNTTHGAFARILPQALNDDFQAARNDPNAVSLADEIALLRTFLAHYLATFQDDQPITADELERVARHVERIGRLVTRQARLLAQDPERRIREERAACAQHLLALVQQVLREFVPDPTACAAAHSKLADLLLQHNLLDEPVSDGSAQLGSPTPARERCSAALVPSEERVRAVSVGAQLGDECCDEWRVAPSTSRRGARANGE